MWIFRGRTGSLTRPDTFQIMIQTQTVANNAIFFYWEASFFPFEMSTRSVRWLVLVLILSVENIFICRCCKSIWLIPLMWYESTKIKRLLDIRHWCVRKLTLHFDMVCTMYLYMHFSRIAVIRFQRSLGGFRDRTELVETIAKERERERHYSYLFENFIPFDFDRWIQSRFWTVFAEDYVNLSEECTKTYLGSILYSEMKNKIDAWKHFRMLYCKIHQS